MSGFSLKGLCALAVLGLLGCGSPSTPPGGTPAKSAPPDQLNRIVERYWDERLPLQNALSPQYLADSLSIERRYLAELLTLSREALDDDSRLSYDIFKRQREETIEGLTFPGELMPINPFGGMTQRLAESAQDLGRSRTAADYDNWLKLIDEYVRWTQQAIANMREGVRRGYTSPRALVERALPILESLAVDGPDNVLNAPLHSMPEAIDEQDRNRLTKAMSNATTQHLLPAIRVLHDYLQHDYLPRARAGVALSELPLGPRWYAYRVKRAASLGLAPEEIHRIGIAEVERLGVPAQPTIETPAGAPRSATELVSAYQDLAGKVRAALPDLFSDAPFEDLEIRGTQWPREPLAPLSYQRAGPAGIPPAVLYVDTLRGIERGVVVPGFLQQAVPGHHYQIALQQGRTDLPRFRRFGAEAAFIEGWGMYAASLGDALGLNPDEAARSDLASGARRCAVGAVVDTGLHAKGWTRTQALDYLRAHLPVDEKDAQALIDWYSANPADALACLMGEREFIALRARAQQLLGGRFDIRQFHSEILKMGAMPLDILETRMKIWMDASK
jgi:uncharacterized protein (DUF885 family)